MCMMNVRVLCFLICVCGLFSCSSIQTFSFEQLCPAKVTLPVQVQTVAVVNNMPVIPKAKNNLATLGTFDGSGKLSTEALADVLADAKYFDQVIICDSALNDLRAEGNGYRPLTHDEVKKLAADLGVDVIFSLDRVSISNEKKLVEYPGMFESWPVVRTRVTSVLHVYSPVREKPLYAVVSADSVEWNLNDVPSDIRMITEMARFSAAAMGRELVPYWTPAERIYYAGGCVEMRDAAISVNEGDWRGAYSLWKQLYDGRKSGNMKAHAALNLSLAAEMEGRLDEAKDWLDKAKPYIKDGSEEDMVWKFNSLQLSKRATDFLHLHSQMSRFENN